MNKWRPVEAAEKLLCWVKSKLGKDKGYKKLKSNHLAVLLWRLASCSCSYLSKLLLFSHRQSDFMLDWHIEKISQTTVGAGIPSFRPLTSANATNQMSRNILVVNSARCLVENNISNRGFPREKSGRHQERLGNRAGGLYQNNLMSGVLQSSPSPEMDWVCA